MATLRLCPIHQRGATMWREDGATIIQCDADGCTLEVSGCDYAEASERWNETCEREEETQ